jgi:hypothetical protein
LYFSVVGGKAHSAHDVDITVYVQSVVISGAGEMRKTTEPEGQLVIIFAGGVQRDFGGIFALGQTQLMKNGRSMPNEQFSFTFVVRQNG